MRTVAVIVGVAALLAVVALSCRRSSAPSAPSASSVSGAGVAWSNEPAGLTALTDRAWNNLSGGGWNRRASTDDRIVDDTTAPAPAKALEYVFPAGFAGGTAPATHYYALGARRELFVGLEWKVNQPWQGHQSLVNKIQFVYTPTSDIAMVMYGPKNGPFELRVMPQWRENESAWLVPNANRIGPDVGRWHRLEWYLKYESAYGAADGVVRWWLDGSLVGDYANVRYPSDAGLSEYQISPTWGGVGDMKTETDYYRFNRSYISSR